MSALRQLDFHEYYPQGQAQQRNDTRRSKFSVSQSRTQTENYQHLVRTQVKSGKVLNKKAFPASNNLPHNLKALSLLQKGSFGLAIASMTASIGLYISTVQIPKLWSQEHQHMEDLQLQERQLISINETIKYQIAQEANQNNSLAISKPESAVFISPAKVESRQQSSNTADELEAAALKYSSLGY